MFVSELNETILILIHFIMNSQVANLVTPKPANKGFYCKQQNNVFFNGYLLSSENMRKLNINELITYKSLLITL